MIHGLGFAMALQFKPDGRGGFLYRRDQIGPALAATAAERDGYIRWMGWMVLVGAVLYFAGMVGMAMLADRLITSDSNTVGVIGAVVMGVTAFTGLYLFLRWASHAPARAFTGRAELAPAIRRKDLLGKRFARLTYTRIFLGSVGLALFCVVGTLHVPDAIWVAVALPAAVGIGFAIWKWRIGTE